MVRNGLLATALVLFIVGCSVTDDDTGPSGSSESDPDATDLSTQLDSDVGTVDSRTQDSASTDDTDVDTGPEECGAYTSDYVCDGDFVVWCDAEEYVLRRVDCTQYFGEHATGSAHIRRS